ncbi:type I secretion system permease/ATPase [Caulobacter vibrioides]|uniref:RsaA secretion system, ATP-binding protein RsaD n=3 Tax=Caulobacter vibrioides TaxID=155892 RepID=H7C7G5_CAUVC|nr:type I secretion system permease/ATPase [Caulobacter vibrioides]YP_002516433.1 type I protein secretion ATP-binding protein RsaD [Caulobacter vibrioides NA1000]AAC38666.2 ABC transporter [Caulobacter vibrioides NA1000]AAK22992.1 RsaA secretion system, ATP-binding protein RsaD [Caulobacter vibrioides CB15]ACL94525.1 type I protein secretion ATP-binding protein RsaD [Caulobacter vibrioides NA1000]ATC27842.1 type I secretion system permease/ATPase [Caulobacter vibrioides]QXZ53086.1 type I sec
MFKRSGAKPTILDQAVLVARPAVITAMVFSFFINILALVSPLYMLQVYDRVLTSRNVSTLIVLTVICVFLFLVYGLLEALRTQVLVRGGLKFDGVARDPIFKSVLDSTLSRKGIGGQAFRDMDQVREFMTGGLIAFCDAPWTPVFVIVSWMLHPFFGILAIIACIIIFGLAVMNDNATKNPIQMATMASIAAQNDAGSTLRNAEVMKAMGMWGGLQARWRARRDEQVAWQAAASDAGGAVMSGIKVFRNIVQTLILGGGAYLAIDGKISAGAMIAGSILVGRALAPIEGAVGQWKNYIGARGAWDRLQTMLREEKSADDHMPLPEPRGVLSAEAASILPPGAQQPTMRQASFRIDAGAAVALVGPSAAGKSSLLRGIVGVWPCAAGVIRLDGYDIKQWDPEKLGRHVGYLPQDIELFSGTVAQNIARFTEFESQEVIEAATLAGVHEMIQSLPMGYDTAIGEGGASLSGGQRQRLALARAVFRMPALLVLDEPNASLDQVGEVALMEAMKRLKAAKRTVIFATHKVNLLAQADYIMVINQGVISDFGERDPMLAKLTGAAPPQTPPPTPPPAPLQRVQ